MHGVCLPNLPRPDGTPCLQGDDKGFLGHCHNGFCDNPNAGFCRQEIDLAGCTLSSKPCVRACKRGGRCQQFSSGCGGGGHKELSECVYMPNQTPCVVGGQQGLCDAEGTCQTCGDGNETCGVPLAEVVDDTCEFIRADFGRCEAADDACKGKFKSKGSHCFCDGEMTEDTKRCGVMPAPIVERCSPPLADASSCVPAGSALKGACFTDQCKSFDVVVQVTAPNTFDLNLFKAELIEVVLDAEIVGVHVLSGRRRLLAQTVDVYVQSPTISHSDVLKSIVDSVDNDGFTYDILDVMTPPAASSSSKESFSSSGAGIAVILIVILVLVLAITLAVLYVRRKNTPKSPAPMDGMTLNALQQQYDEPNAMERFSNPGPVPAPRQQVRAAPVPAPRPGLKPARAAPLPPHKDMDTEDRWAQKVRGEQASIRLGNHYEQEDA